MNLVPREVHRVTRSARPGPPWAATGMGWVLTSERSSGATWLDEDSPVGLGLVQGNMDEEAVLGAASSSQESKRKGGRLWDVRGSSQV